MDKKDIFLGRTERGERNMSRTFTVPSIAMNGSVLVSGPPHIGEMNINAHVGDRGHVEIPLQILHGSTQEELEGEVGNDQMYETVEFVVGAAKRQGLIES